MYRLELIERLKSPQSGRIARVSPTVWKLGFTSLLTDISSEMVSSLLPVYLVLYLHMSPLQYGAIDGIYNGIAIALLSLAGGYIADRTRRHKEVAAFGYGISAACKLLLLAVGSAWGWIAAVIAIDRIGKGARTAPRDALISLNTAPQFLASAFAVHRALDAGGALIGPVLAFAILTKMPAAFDVVWVTSFVFALIGFAVLWLFVKNPEVSDSARANKFSWREMKEELVRRNFRTLALAGTFLAFATVSDGFIYLLLQRRSGTAMGFFPLFYIATAGFYMLLSVPLGRIADRWGRVAVFLGGYGAIAAIYIYLLLSTAVGLVGSIACLFLLGLYYAASDGVLMAMASSVISAERRTSGLALLGTAVNLGKMASSLLFGWLWQTWGTQTALLTFAIGLAIAVPMSTFWLRSSRDAKLA